MKNIDNMNIDELLDFLERTAPLCGTTSFERKLAEASANAKKYAPKHYDECSERKNYNGVYGSNKKYIMDIGGTISLVPVENGALNFAHAEIQTPPVDVIVDGELYRIEPNNKITLIPNSGYMGDAYEVIGDNLLEAIETIREDRRYLS